MKRDAERDRLKRYNSNDLKDKSIKDRMKISKSLKIRPKSARLNLYDPAQGYRLKTKSNENYHDQTNFTGRTY